MWPCLNYEAWPAFEANRINKGAITGKSKTSICIAFLVSEVEYMGNNSHFFHPKSEIECKIGIV